MAGYNMKKLKTAVILAPALVVLLAGVCLADTFTNRQTSEKLHGYITARLPGSGQSARQDSSSPKDTEAENGPTSVYTQEKGLLKLNLNEWEMVRDRSGRNNKVIVVPVDDAIIYEIEADAFEKVLADSSQEGPLFILVEIDTPGGRIDLAHRMCTAITKDTDCNIFAFVKGGQHGGAISAGAAVALACSKIYMANNTVIGAATLVTMPKDRKDYENNRKKNYGDIVDEKSSSVWRAYLASLAQQNNRPGLLARAMVDRDIAVVEVNQAGKRLFIEPVNKRPEQQVVRTWNKTGSLVTLTAEEAVECTIADGLVGSREQLLQQLQAGDANVVTDKKIVNARKELQIAKRRMDDIVKSLDLKIKQSKYPQPAAKVLGILQGARSDFENLKTLAKKYPDLDMDVKDIEKILNSIQADYENTSREARNRR
jgi:ATP-dependent protease ClpP protease subunit